MLRALATSRQPAEPSPLERKLSERSLVLLLSASPMAVPPSGFSWLAPNLSEVSGPLAASASPMAEAPFVPRSQLWSESSGMER